MNEFGLVVCRYHENLKWLSKINSPIDIYVYNRHEDKKNIGGLEGVSEKVSLNMIDMEDDMGHEPGVYAYHCHTKYDSLNDYTVFVQADPFIHCSNIIDRLNNPFALKHTYYYGTNTGPSLLPPKVEVKEEPIDFQFLTDAFGWITPMYDHGWSPYREDFSQIPTAPFMIGKPWETHPNGWPFGTGQHFIVHKNLIRGREVDLWKKIQKFSIDYIDPFPVPHLPKHYGTGMMEAIWGFIFKGQPF